MKINGLALLVVLALGVGGSRWLAGGHHENAPSTRAAASESSPSASAQGEGIEVETALVEAISLPRGIAAVGTLRSENSAMLRPEIAGRITSINFDEGGRVKRGQVLIRLDDSIARAELQQAEANFSLASSQHRRAVELTKQGFISKQARDEASSRLKVQQAAVALARAHLEKTIIAAPFDGMIGLRNVSVGDYVSPGEDLVPIESVDPLKVDFRVPEQYLEQASEGQELALRFDALPGEVRSGVVGAISPLVDVGGRSILLRAQVPNPDGLLRPGMFARVQLQFADVRALVVPETALAPSGDSQYVFRVTDGRVHRVPVEIGQRRATKVEVTKGLQEGDQVVVAGLQKVQDGAAVRAVPAARSVAAR